MAPVLRSSSDLAMARPSRTRRSAVLGCAALALAAFSAPATFANFASGRNSGTLASGSQVLGNRDVSAIAMRPVNPYYSDYDRVTLGRARKELRREQREHRQRPVQKLELNYDKLPSIEDIYARKYSGDADTDPIGGRKRFTFYMFFKTENFVYREVVTDYITFFKSQMSCKDIFAKGVASPIDSNQKVMLEYPMKEYGQVPRTVKKDNTPAKKQHSQAYMVRFQMKAPIGAIEQIEKKVYDDNRVLRIFFLGHTRTFVHLGEDNELHL